MTDPNDRPGTKISGWEANEHDRLAVGMRATPAERVAWLEEAIALAYRTGALPRRRPEEGDSAQD